MKITITRDGNVFKDNVPGFPGYHVTKDGEVYSMKCRSGKKRYENKESNSSKR